LWLAERKEEIIGKVNKDFVKPWFDFPSKQAQERPKRIQIEKVISKTAKTLNMYVTMVSLHRI